MKNLQRPGSFPPSWNSKPLGKKTEYPKVASLAVDKSTDAGPGA